MVVLHNGPWATALPQVLVFPMLLWVAIRCRPIFAAALAVGLTVIGSTTLNVGYFESGKPHTDRILSAQIFVYASLILGDDQVGTEFRSSEFLNRVYPEDRQRFKTLIRELRPRTPS